MDNPAQVLIIDGDGISVMLLKRQFEQAGVKLQFSYAATGEEALQHLAAQGPPSLVIAEPVLPDMDPKTFLAKLVSAGLLRRITICLLSSLYTMQLQELAQEFPVSCYFSKPVEAGYIPEFLRMIIS